MTSELPPAKVVFKNKQLLGDTLTMTAGVRDFCVAFPDTDVGVETSFPALWDHNPRINPNLKSSVIYDFEPGPKYGTSKSNKWSLHMTNSFRMDMENKMGVSIPAGDVRPELWMSKEEYERPPLIEGVYWIIVVGGEPKWSAKMYPMEGWQAVVDGLPRIKFVQLQRDNDPRPRLNNVIDAVGKTENIRDLMNVFLHAQGSVGLVSMHMHMSAAFNNPCVVVAGAREPQWFTHYLGHQYLNTVGTLPCSLEQGRARACWKCSTEACLKKQEDSGMEPHLVHGTTPPCVALILPADVSRAIASYYMGGVLKFGEKAKPRSVMNIVDELSEYKGVVVKKAETVEEIRRKDWAKVEGGLEVNILASLRSKGGGEQSVCTITKMLRDAGVKVNLYPWEGVHDNHKWAKPKSATFKNGMEGKMKKGLPLLFYANDQIGAFCKEAQKVVEKSSSVGVAVNYVNGPLPKCKWLADTGKLKAVFFQNQEKAEEFDRANVCHNKTKSVLQPGAIDLGTFLKSPVCKKDKKVKDATLVVLKHCVADPRKYVTSSSVGQGDIKHIWQRNIVKERDVDFYSRLLKNVKNVRFEFMEAHKELVDAFKGEDRMVFHKWNAMPVEKFLARGHVYLYRTSNQWRDQYPRVVGEALAAGLPVLTEPRDGTMDRVLHGDTGFYCVDYDGFQYALKLLQRKEEYRQQMGKRAKQWAAVNLDPKRWVGAVVENLCNG